MIGEGAMAPRRPRPEPAWRIAVVSAAILILELAFIRQIPAEVRVISYFTNLVLIASFFGLGLGCLLQRWRTLSWLLPAGLALVLAFVHYAGGIVIYEETRAVHFWLQYEGSGEVPRMPLFAAALCAFVAVCLPFIALGQALARRMDEHPRLAAYGWDIGGSLLGTALFTGSSLFGVPPWLWVVAVGCTWAALFETRWSLRLATAVAAVGFVLFARTLHSGRWSPYYFVQHEREPVGLRVWVNSSFHQLAIDFTGSGDADTQALMRAKFGRPYDVYRRLHAGVAARKVLVLGAGTGNDVVVALENGAREVVAVEIDPTILQLGRTHNPARPYAAPGVRTVVDDARHFLRSTNERFDLVVFGTLDSQALLSGHANLRLENYVYTRESLTDARRVLNPTGMAVIHYSVFQGWLYSRIYSTARAVFGEQTVLLVEATPHLFNTTILAGRDLPGLRDSAEHVARLGRGLVATDDWPFVYLERPAMAPVYVQILAVVLLLVAAAFVVLRRVHPVRGLNAEFLLLGLGFTLMEAAAVVRLALLFGSTWTVNAAVFAAVLATILLANVLVQWSRAPPLRVSFPLLWLCVLANWALPVGLLFALPLGARVLATALLVGAPVFCAAVCFSRLFADEPVTGYPLGLNLVGAMAGGVLEYISMVTGMRAVWLLVLVIYMLAWLFTRRARLLAAPSAALPGVA
jgi:SAM-dependent methyltransferase